MKINDALNEIERLQKELAAAKLIIDLQEKIIKDLNLNNDKKIEEYELLSEKKRIAEIDKFVKKSEVLDTIINEPEEIKKEEKEKKKRGIKTGSKKHKNFDFESKVSETIYKDPIEDTCPYCGQKLDVASEKIRYEVRYVPAKLEVIKIIKRSKVCKKCNKKNNKIYCKVASTPFPGSILTPSFAAWILNHKYYLGIPFNKLEEYIKESLKIEVSKQSLADYAAKSASLLEPVYSRMKDDLLNDERKVIHSDETTLVVSKNLMKIKIERNPMYMYIAQDYIVKIKL